MAKIVLKSRMFTLYPLYLEPFWDGFGHINIRKFRLYYNQAKEIHTAMEVVQTDAK